VDGKNKESVNNVTFNSDRPRITIRVEHLISSLDDQGRVQAIND